LSDGCNCSVGACLLSPELAGLLHAANLYVIQQAAIETQPATGYSDSITASTSDIFVNENENENEKDQQFVHENENEND